MAIKVKAKTPAESSAQLPEAHTGTDECSIEAVTPALTDVSGTCPTVDAGTLEVLDHTTRSEAVSETISESNNPVPETDLPVAEPIDRMKLGWNSPSYSTSRSVTLDPHTLQGNRCIAFDGDIATIDSYKVIRAQILERMKSSNANTLMVTSVLPGEGKTTTAINLAFIMAKEFQQTVLLVDCDLQQQDIHKRLGYQSDKGLINYLLDDVPLPELFTWPGIEKITLISGGRTIRDSSELLGSPRMKELVSDMKTRYPNRFVIFDMQSTFAGADTLVFSPLVDNILLVIQEGNSSAKDIKRAISLLPEDKLLGLMLNRHKAASHIVTRQDSRKNN
jgi:non-specific protein-tyrosine kinase